MTNELPHPRHRWFAKFYDFFDHMDDKRMIPLRKRLLEGLSGTVLEVGSGTGGNFEHYEFGPIETLEATEPDPFMRGRAEEKASALPEAARAKLRLSEAPAEALPFPDAHFEAVVSCLVLCTVSDLSKSLQEMRRVLKPGGELRLLEHVAAEGRWRTVQGAIQPVYGWVSAGCRLDRHTEDAVRAAGFSLDVSERTGFSPVHPAFRGVGRKLSQS
jgi:ubiquinone/menaquinone biosynthesis C-methylase UbiE